MKTRQQAFDTMVTHLLTQGERAHRDGVCLYRGPKEGSKCAIGVLIPDEQYSSTMEGHSLWQNPEVQDILVDCGYNTSDFSFFNVLQKVHDQEPTHDWKKVLHGIAKQYKLKFNPPKVTA